MRYKAILLAWVLLLPAIGTAREPWEGPWIELRTPHFVIFSGMEEQRSIDLAVELEEFRTVVDLMTGGGGVDEPIATRIYLLPKTMPELGFRGGVLGYFRPEMRANFAVMVPSGRESDAVLKHEYTHYLVRNRGGRYPAWIDEGVAEVFSTMVITDEVIAYGTIPTVRRDWLTSERWMPFADVLAARDLSNFSSQQIAMFYAQSWLLMQYLMVGRDGVDLRAELGEFMRRSEAGESPGEAFTATWGIEVAELDEALGEYTRRFRIMRAALETPYPVASVARRTMTEGEVAGQLGLLALLYGNHDDAREFYDAALELQPENTVALIGIADLHKFADRFDEAQPLYERAIALEPDNGWHQLDYGEYFLSRARAESDPGVRRQWLIEARRRFARSFQLDAKNPEMLHQNGLTYLFDGEDTAKGVQSLEVAYELLPSHERIQFDLARGYIAVGESDLARQLLRRLLAGAHSSLAEEVTKLLTSIESP